MLPVVPTHALREDLIPTLSTIKPFMAEVMGVFRALLAESRTMAARSPEAERRRIEHFCDITSRYMDMIDARIQAYEGVEVFRPIESMQRPFRMLSDCVGMLDAMYLQNYNDMMQEGLLTRTEKHSAQTLMDALFQVQTEANAWLATLHVQTMPNPTLPECAVCPEFEARHPVPLRALLAEFRSNIAAHNQYVVSHRLGMARSPAISHFIITRRKTPALMQEM